MGSGILRRIRSLAVIVFEFFWTRIFAWAGKISRSICTTVLRYRCGRIKECVPPLEISAWRWRGNTHRARLHASVPFIVAADYLGDTRRMSFRCNVSCVARQEIESVNRSTEESKAEFPLARRVYRDGYLKSYGFDGAFFGGASFEARSLDQIVPAHV